NTFVVNKDGTVYQKDSAPPYKKDGGDDFVVSNAGTIYRKDPSAARETDKIFNPTGGGITRKPAPDAIERPSRMIADASSELKQTVVTAYLQHEHRAGENLMRCKTMQLA